MERRRANDLANQEWHGGGLPRREVRAREFRRRGRRCPRAEAAPLLASASSLSNSRWSAGTGRSPRGPGAAERLALPGEEITPRLHRAVIRNEAGAWREKAGFALHDLGEHFPLFLSHLEKPRFRSILLESVRTRLHCLLGGDSGFTSHWGSS